MKVLDLHCPAGHVFEGWFASEDDFQKQLQRRLVQCPVCGDSDVTKRLSAPRLNLGAQPPQPTQAPHPAPAAAPARAASPEISAEARAYLQSMQAAWMQWSRKVAQSSEDVGRKFAEEARRIHYGETEERAIRGQTSAREAMELIEEGIGVLPLALPESASGEGGSGSLQ
ncbi:MULTISPECIES: DUF1178 family protein [Comamonas]|jgi:hypothetical protein|uniref:DUF1178 family protein n=1 Tax=Comamonas TaxID=283 RepID=UPI0012C15DCC|nr:MULTISPECIES: DUF1178 family protein [Comamonas]MDR3065899.1 DUF1178 family protein [Comamonas sp.]MEB5965466.1 DUF1178 family protein [Comamonas testosteroni]MPS94324.1 DUF1178 family protein [Comamonas sp.]